MSLVVTWRAQILTTNLAVHNENNITNSTSEGADQQVITHVLNSRKQTNYSDILACTYCTYVLMLVVAYALFFIRT